MPYFAQLDDNNIVTKVISISRQECIDPHTGEEDEIIGIAQCKKLCGGNWKQTSFNGTIRKRYAGIGMVYNAEKDAFICQQPYPSWTLDNTDLIWVSPLGAAPEPTDEERLAGKNYEWDESAYQADNTQGWVLRS